MVRVWKTGHDSRFDEAKHQPFKFWIYWTMQVCLRLVQEVVCEWSQQSSMALGCGVRTIRFALQQPRRHQLCETCLLLAHLACVS